MKFQTIITNESGKQIVDHNNASKSGRFFLETIKTEADVVCYRIDSKNGVATPVVVDFTVGWLDRQGITCPKMRRKAA